MLREINIRGLGVIESAHIELSPGLTVLSGETGAGKTMVLTALSLILGAKSDSELVRKGEERIVASGSFEISDEVAAALDEEGSVIEDGTVIITRTVTALGKSRVLIGGVLATAARVGEVTDPIIEIHAQASNAKLLKSTFQRELLDRFAQLEIQLGLYENELIKYRELESRIKELRKRLKERDEEMRLLTAFLESFDEISPKFGELDEIENEISKLGSVELLNTELSRALTILEDDDESIFTQLNRVRKSLELTKGKDQRLDLIVESYLDNMYNLQETAGDLASYVTGLEADPIRFDFLQLRKQRINALIKKYGQGEDKAIAYENLLQQADSARQELHDLAGGDDRLIEMQGQMEALFSNLRKLAFGLTLARRSSCESLSQLVTAELGNLSMPHATFVVELSTRAGESISDYHATGLDEVSFLFSSHKQAANLVLTKVASGGEMSRVMLAIDVVLARNSKVSTYIFDEVDAGVGGKAAIEVGQRLAMLAKDAQVIVVTHLAQVAAWADRHYVVRKSENGSVTQSDVEAVEGASRVIEIARMLSGQEESDRAREHAEELLNLVRERMIS